MAVTDNASSRFLNLDNWLQEQYFDRLIDHDSWMGSATNRIFGMASDMDVEVVSDGLNVQVMTGHQDIARGSTTFHSAFPTARSPIDDKVKIRWSESSGSSNDFTTIKIRAKATYPEIMSQSKGAIVNVAARVFKDMAKDYDQKLATFRNVRKTGLLARVNGTPKKDDRLYFLDASATATNAAGARFPVDGGSISYFHKGVHLDVYNGSTKVLGNVEVDYVNTDPGDLSIGVKWNTGTDDDSTTGSGTTLGDIADNYSLYFSDGYNQGMYGFSEWFSRPAATGDSFIGAKDRNAIGSRWMVTKAVREGATANVPISRTHFNAAARACGYKWEEQQNVVAVMSPEILDSLRAQLDDNSVVMTPQTGEGRRAAVMGADAVFYIHPQFGRVELLGDPMATPNTVRIMTREDWMSCHFLHKGFTRITRGSEISPFWYSLNEDTPGTGRSLTYATDALAIHCDFCKVPDRQVSIQAVTAA